MTDIVDRLEDFARRMEQPNTEPEAREICDVFNAAKEIARLRTALATAGVKEGGAIADIVAERKRQIEQEGWAPEHDDEHGYGEIARAAASYAVAGSVPTETEDKTLARDMEQTFPYHPTDQVGSSLSEMLRSIETLWPWNWSWWKPTTRRRNLIKAGALIVAEIERLDRSASPTQSPAALGMER